MKHFISILALSFFIACNKEPVPSSVSTGRPIVFSTGVTISTRGESISDLKGKSFGVRGYIYKNLWDIERPLAIPDQNWLNTRINCANTGECAYDNLQEWQYKRNYAFFAYYPYSKNSKGTITLSSPSACNTPVLKYKLHPDAFNDINSMDDVMYAYRLDANESSTPKVNLRFKHCFTALQLVIENLNDYPIDLCELIMKIQVKHDVVEIPLDGGPIVPQGIILQPDQTNASYTYISSPVTIGSTLNRPYYDILPDNYLLMIPQTGTIVELSYKNKPTDKAYKVVQRHYEQKEFKPGQRYLISLQFVGKNINVLVIDAEAWQDNITDIEFE